MISNSPFASVYSGRKVLVTGHTGFKGSWLSIWLKALGAEVIGYSLEPPSVPSNFGVCDLESKITDIYGDVRSLEHLKEVFKKYNPEMIFHLAAQPLVRLSYGAPHTTYETNVMGTVNLLETVRQTRSVRVVVNITSDKCYENKEWIWGYRENDPMGGYDPYSSSKGCAELVTAAYRQSFFNPERCEEHKASISSVRAGNVIGGGDWGEDRLIPDCIRALSEGQEIVVRYPNAVRPWQHVLEPLSGYLLLGAKLWDEGPKYSGAWNFGPMDDEVWTVEDVVKETIRYWGEGSYRVEGYGNPHEAHWLKLDCSKARMDLKWKTRYSVKQALEKTIDWYRMFYVGRKADDLMEFTRNQIDGYLKT